MMKIYEVVNDQVIHVLLLIVCALLYWDAHMAETKLKLMEQAVQTIGLDMNELVKNIKVVNDELVNISNEVATNKEEDEKFREQQAKFDKNVIGVFRQKGLLEK